MWDSFLLTEVNLQNLNHGARREIVKFLDGALHYFQNCVITTE